VDGNAVDTWVLPDHLGSVRDVMNNAGLVVDHLNYGAFGSLTYEQASSPVVPFGYAGYVADAGTGLDFAQARYYAPALGRFLTQDPSGLGPDSNPYRYVGNDPTDATDPSGLWNLWNPLTWGTGNPNSDRWYNKINPVGESAHWGATGEGLYEGGKNVIFAPVKIAKEVILSDIDVVNGLIAAASGEKWGYRGNLSQTGQAIQNGASATEFYKDAALNGITFGTYQQYQIAKNLYDGVITADEASQQFAASGFSQLLTAKALKMGANAKARAQRAAPKTPFNKVPPEQPPFDPSGTLGAAKAWTIKGRLKAAQLPTSGKVRYVPPEDYSPGQPLPRGPQNGYIDRFGNEWTRGPSRTAGQPFEWDVQLGKNATNGVKWASPDGKHLNVSLDGEVTH
jgi:RHS repeat-associated protein